jgi:hypothetical protein
MRFYVIMHALVSCNPNVRRKTMDIGREVKIFEPGEIPAPVPVEWPVPSEEPIPVEWPVPAETPEEEPIPVEWPVPAEQPATSTV